MRNSNVKKVIVSLFLLTVILLSNLFSYESLANAAVIAPKKVSDVNTISPNALGLPDRPLPIYCPSCGSTDPTAIVRLPDGSLRCRFCGGY